MSNQSNKSTPPLIELCNASVMRGDQVVIKEMCLRIEVGEHVAILGPNGCGKSTLVRTLAREFYPLQRPGSFIRLFGREVWNVFELWSLLGIVSNHFPDPLALGDGQGTRDRLFFQQRWRLAASARHQRNGRSAPTLRWH